MRASRSGALAPVVLSAARYNWPVPPSLGLMLVQTNRNETSELSSEASTALNCSKKAPRQKDQKDQKRLGFVKPVRRANICSSSGSGRGAAQRSVKATSTAQQCAEL